MKALARFLYGPFLAWAILSAAVLTWTDPAGAQQPSWSPQMAADRDLLVTLTVRARRCMYDGSEAMFRNGVTQRAPVTIFTKKMCSEQLRWFYTDRARLTEREADLLVQGHVDAAYESALSWGRPFR